MPGVQRRAAFALGRHPLLWASLLAACKEPTSPLPEQLVELSVEAAFAFPPSDVTTLVAQFTRTSDGTSTTFALSVVSGTGNRLWTATGSVTTGTHSVTVEARNSSSTLLYYAATTVNVTSDGGTFYFVLTCVSALCDPQTGNTVTVYAILPELESEENNALSTADALSLFTFNSDSRQFAAANGYIDASDSDYFFVTFSGLIPGDTLILDVYSDRLGQALDGVLTLYSTSGSVRASADQTIGNDPRIVYTVGSDGADSYYLQVQGFGGSTGRYTLGAFACYLDTGCGTPNGP
jgi:hypothetical protein